ncbi:chloride channel protein [Larsenimonas suaedae]|uniref:Chloride channel protein n=1 Tax=Larsenimonas suaedae TaxID=1851019 RepID=A0ABU1GR31_9GAMM|nr:chloride channel protein [Larsenimonas suaedae]MCM2972716.1 chloride channel protein [Larsenimonas suaedae]MDR5894487.1 chloride channel protein [Larsenimonas suaedae]
MRRLSKPHFTLDTFRRQLASIDALPQLCILGVLSGILTGAIMVGFRQVISIGAALFMPNGNSEAFEQLTPYIRTGLPIVVALVIMGGLAWQPLRRRNLGIGHVIERLTYHQGQMPSANWLNQWWVGVLSVLGGLSAGREGPAIHLGAGASSWMGERLRLPHNSLRVLVGCGTAAGISASFNTPITGVIFAMEVVMMSYTLTGFMPIILASTMGAVVAQLAYGVEPAFTIPDHITGHLIDLPWITVMALVIGILAGSFIWLVRFAQRHNGVHWSLRSLAIGGATAMIAWWYPEVQGIGYDTVGFTLNEDPSLDLLLMIACGKLMLTALTFAWGIPIGVIGPIMVIGATAGALCGIAGEALFPTLASDHDLYTMLGMAAMLGAVLQAPLAALMVLIELTHNTEIILYGMLAVVVSGLTSRQCWHCRGFFISTLTQEGLHPLQQPLMQALSRVAVPAVMDRSIARAAPVIERAKAQRLMEGKPVWIIVTPDDDDKSPVALAAADLARVLLDEHWEEVDSINLLEIPAQRLALAPIDLQATLSEAFDQLNEYGVDALYVEHTTAPLVRKISGIITREAIENYYRYRR